VKLFLFALLLTLGHERIRDYVISYRITFDMQPDATFVYEEHEQPRRTAKLTWPMEEF
jgi:hypothetical protein